MPIILILLLIMFAPMAQAGAWPREVGTVYLSFGQAFDQAADGTRDRVQTIYGEYGLTDTLTLGVTGWRKTTGSQGELLLFARLPIGNPTGGHRFAAELALGARKDDAGKVEAVLQPGLAWGKGFDSMFGPGWVSFETSLGLALGSGELRPKTGFSIGLRPGEKTRIMLQLRADHEGSMTLAPSYMRQMGERLDVELGLQHRLSGQDRAGVIAGAVLEF